jgi:hypothetical protein
MLATSRENEAELRERGISLTRGLRSRAPTPGPDSDSDSDSNN